MKRSHVIAQRLTEDRRNVTAAKMGNFLGVPCTIAPPKQSYRPAIWENMLGTVLAMNDARETKYFDYDHAGAIAWAGITPDRDCRLYKVQQTYAWSKNGQDPGKGKLVLWVGPAAGELETRQKQKSDQKLILLLVSIADGHKKLSDNKMRELYEQVKTALTDTKTKHLSSWFKQVFTPEKKKELGIVD